MSITSRYETAAKEYQSALKTVIQSEEERDDHSKDGQVSVVSKITGILGKHTTDQQSSQAAAFTAKVNMFCNEVSLGEG